MRDAAHAVDLARLVSWRCQSEVSANRARAAEVKGCFDGRHEACRDNDAHAGAGHQQAAGRIALGCCNQPAVEDGNLVANGAPSRKQWHHNRSHMRSVLEQLPHPGLKRAARSLPGLQPEGLQHTVDLVRQINRDPDELRARSNKAAQQMSAPAFDPCLSKPARAQDLRQGLGLKSPAGALAVCVALDVELE